MHSPTIDIIVPVWNHPFETRACLSAILAYSPEARLIIVDNASSRETEVMLEEFSEPLGERALFITSERNIGLVPAINLGLARSDRDYAVVLRPNVRPYRGWLDRLCHSAEGGIASPLFKGKGAPQLPPVIRGCSIMETFRISFFTLVLKGEMHTLLGGFDEQLDGGEWCLRDYVRRAWSRGYRTRVCSEIMLDCADETVYGSKERLLELTNSSRNIYQQHWGVSRHYVIYFGREAEAGNMAETVESILEGARQGHLFTLLLHRRQFAEFRRRGWNGLHTGIRLQALSLFAPRRALHKQAAELQANDPEIVLVEGVDGVPFPGADAAIPFSEVAATIAAAPSV